MEVAKLHKEGYDFIMIGHKGHPEVEGTMGQLSEGIYLVEDVADVETLQVAQSERLALYSALGYPVVALSARSDVAPLRPRLQGKVSVLVGQSGVGKSTIVNALLPYAFARTNEISEALGAGRHTTTHARLYHLDAESSIIDSPGLQAFGLHHIHLDALAQGFVEFRQYIGRCRFRDCHHLGEPGCAIEAATAEGGVSARRLAAYRALARERDVKRAMPG